MRHLLRVSVVGLVFLSSGCGQSQPTLAGGMPVSHWVQALHEPDVRLRKKAVLKLGNVGAADPTVVPALVGAVRDPDARVRAEAILALLKIGPAAREAVPVLAEAQKDRDPKVRVYATKALEKIQGDK